MSKRDIPRNNKTCEITKHVKEQNITNVIITGDFNQGISEKAIREFFAEIEITDVHSKMNNVATMH